MNPHQHPCTIGELDYSMVKQGQITCKVCGRFYQFIPNKGWWATPVTKEKPPFPQEEDL